MLMTYTPEVDHISDAGKRLLALIEAAGDAGISRPQLAQAVGKKRLNLWDDAQLNRLAADGTITVSQRPSQRPHILEYVYRATGKE